MSGIPEKEAPLKALIVEDVEDDALLLVQYLQLHGRDVDWHRVDTEQALLAAFERRAWDVVFSDFTMPRFDGAQALALTRSQDADVPFIFVSGTIGEEAVVKAMKAGAQDFVMKGQMERLMPALERGLREAQARRERRREKSMLSKLSLAVTQAADSVFIMDRNGFIEYVNPAFERLTGYGADEVRGHSPDVLCCNEQDRDFYRQVWARVTRGEVYRGTLISRHKNGELFYEEKEITPLKDEDGAITHVVSTGRDITARVLAEQSRSQLVDVLEATPDLVAILAPDGCIRYLNGAGKRLLGVRSEAEIEGLCLRDMFPETAAEQSLAEILPRVHRDGSWSGETQLQVNGSRVIPVSQVVVAHRDEQGRLEYISTIAHDISERKRFEAELHHQATHDSLTGLPNRFYLHDRANATLERARRYGQHVALLFLDMDHFKRVNDSIGHAAGDTLLKEVARRLKGCLRPHDTVARLGGDEFVVVAGDLKTPEATTAIVRKLRAAFERPIQVGPHEIYATFSTGIALYPHDGRSVDDMLRHADSAMYQAKGSGSNQYRFYAPGMDAQGHEQLALEADMRRALDHEEFFLHFQPQLDLRSHRMSGVETLLRWRNARCGEIAPADFVPLLESAGMIIDVGEWVLRESCATHRHWREQGGAEGLRVSVNVSATQFTDDDLLDKVRRAVREEGMPAHSLELEITENIVMRDPQHAAELLQALRALGVRTAIDDFGTGYSSLAYLKRFPLNVLKIDRAFVHDIACNPGDAAIVEASISLAQKLGLDIVAEGVETAEQLAFLCDHECDLLQGYYLSRPVPADDVGRLMQKVWQW